MLFQFECLAWFWNDDVFPAFFSQNALVVLHGFSVAVDKESLFDLAWVLTFQVVDKLVVIAMATEGVDRVDVSGHGVFVAKNGNGLGTRISEQLGTQSLR